MKAETKNKIPKVALYTGGTLGGLVIIGGVMVACANGMMEGIGYLEKQGVNQNPSSYIDSINLNEIDLLSDNSFRIIKVENEIDGENFYFTKKVSLYDITSSRKISHLFADAEVYYKYADGEKFEKYYKAPYRWSDTYVYIDLETSNVVSIKYCKENEHWFKDNETTIEYSFNKIISDEAAIDYAYAYYGNGEIYSITEMETVVEQLRTDQEVKTKKLIR